MNVTVSDTPEKAAGAALSKQLRENAGHPVLLLVSLGSARAVLEYVDTAVLGPLVTVGVLDERYTTDKTVHNYSVLSGTMFFKDAIARGVAIIDTTIRPGESMDDFAVRWEGELSAWRRAHPEGTIVVTMGVGPDGHTAGIMPGNSVDTVGNQWVLAYEVPKTVNEHTKRVTVTHSFLRAEVAYACVFVCGEEKRAALTRVVAEEGTVHDTPARILREMRGVDIYTNIAQH